MRCSHAPSYFPDGQIKMSLFRVRGVVWISLHDANEISPIIGVPAYHLDPRDEALYTRAVAAFNAEVEKQND